MLTRSHAPHLGQHWRRALGVLGLCALVIMLLSIDSLFALLHRLLTAAEPVISAHPAGGGWSRASCPTWPRRRLPAVVSPR